ncbi:MAG TPA: hypothetical protein PLJ32_02615 [Kiritimatiellia bacterium]|jgi:hypothetical protein|nr:hypothetical protein [Kiritimatiellia bacterium]
MLTVAGNALLGVLFTLLLGMTDTASWGWSVFWGVIVFVAGQALAGYLIQRRVKSGMEAIQKILLDGQKRLQAKVNQWQNRPPGSLKQAQIEIEREQRVFVERALEASKGLERFKLWAPLMGRQINTLRLQFYWMLKEFKQVDALLPNALFLDPMMAAVKLARMHMKDETEGMERFFRKQTRRLRYGQGALLYGLYAWILVRQQDPDAAHKVLIEACEKMENETLKKNREHLANNRIDLFSNADLGDEWYALHLEQPKVKMQRQQRFSGRPF